MEDIRIENHVVYNQKSFGEWHLRRQIYVFLMAISLTVYAGIVEFSALRHWAYLDWELRGMILVTFIPILILYALPFLRWWLMLHRTRKLYGGTIPETVIQFGEDAITLTALHDRGEMRYDWLKKTKRYHYSYILCFKAGRKIRLEYTGFTKGNLEELQALLREKCPQAHIAD